MHLADAAAGAASLLHFDFAPIVWNVDCHWTEWALVDADLAVFSLTAHAERLVNDSEAHIDLFGGNELKRAGGTGFHAGEVFTHDTRLRFRIDHRSIVPGRIFVSDKPECRDWT